MAGTNLKFLFCKLASLAISGLNEQKLFEIQRSRRFRIWVISIEAFYEAGGFYQNLFKHLLFSYKQKQ